MTEVFGRRYAHAYDSIYQLKDYGREVEVLQSLINEAGGARNCRVLDVGCGTGRHALAMAQLGFEMWGTDRSEDMLTIARERCGHSVRILSAEEIVEPGFDVVYSVFDVLSYQTKIGDTREFLDQMASWTRPGGLVIADAWHMAGMIMDPPMPREAQFKTADGSITRRSMPEVDWCEGITTVRYELSRKTLVGDETFFEIHKMRAYSKWELTLLLELSGLDLIRLYAPIEPWRAPSAVDWHIGFVARRPT